MVAVVSVDSVGFHFLTEVFHLLIVVVQLLPSVDVNGLVLTDFSSLPPHFVRLGISEVIFGESLRHYESFASGPQVYSWRRLHFGLFGMEKLVSSKNANFGILEQFDSLAGFSRFVSGLPSRQLSPSNILIRERLTELPLDLQKSFSVGPKVHRLER